MLLRHLEKAAAAVATPERMMVKHAQKAHQQDIQALAGKAAGAA